MSIQFIRDFNQHAGTLAGLRINFHMPFQQLCAGLEVFQPIPVLVRMYIKSFAVVFNADFEVRTDAGHRHLGLSGSGVLENVGECLMHRQE